MKYLNFEVLQSINPLTYRSHKPFPYIDIEKPFFDDAYRTLVKTAPSDLSLFEKQFGIQRSHGQASHDKYYLAYSEALPLATPWKEFIAELHSREYLSFLEALFNVKPNTYTLTLSWHYMPRGTSISPHCDTPRKIGSQLFYLNTLADWDPAWGGQTLALDDEGKRNPNSGPALSEFDTVFQSKSIDNNSFIFTRTNHSWHAVDTIQCPEGTLRKMFSVVLNRKPTTLDLLLTYPRRIIRLLTPVRYQKKMNGMM